MELHATTADTEPSEFSAGGYWVAVCSACRWTAQGTYSGMPGHATEADALHIAHAMGTEHEARFNPERIRKGAAS